MDKYKYQHGQTRTFTIRDLFISVKLLNYISLKILLFQEIKEACKVNNYGLVFLTLVKFTLNQIFEKVLVQNIQFGLSPSLTSALHSIPRLVKCTNRIS